MIVSLICGSLIAVCLYVGALRGRVERLERQSREQGRQIDRLLKILEADE